MSVNAALDPVSFAPGGRIAAAVRAVKQAREDRRNTGSSSPRGVLYTNGAREERQIALLRCQLWADQSGYAVVVTREDDQRELTAPERRELNEALGYLLAGRAEVLLMPSEVFEALGEDGCAWVRSVAEQCGGRVETVPREPVGSKS